MNYTIISARYANAESSAVVLLTVESGAVACSLRDRPEVWQAMQAWVSGGGVIQAYAPLPVIDLSDFQNVEKLFRAKCVSDLAFRLGKAPGALTLAEIQAERTRIKNIADALP